MRPSSSPAVCPEHAAARRLERDGRSAQAPLLAQLALLQRRGHVRRVSSLWIANAVAMTADASAIDAVRARLDVSSIETDSLLPIHPADATTGEPGVAAAGAPELWSHGIDGRGVTVAVLDTGVDLTDPELASRFRGGPGSWYDPYNEHPDAPRRPQWPRHRGGGHRGRRRRHRHGPGCPVHRRARFQRP